MQQKVSHILVYFLKHFAGTIVLRSKAFLIYACSSPCASCRRCTTKGWTIEPIILSTCSTNVDSIGRSCASYGRSQARCTSQLGSITRCLLNLIITSALSLFLSFIIYLIDQLNFSQHTFECTHMLDLNAIDSFENEKFNFLLPPLSSLLSVRNIYMYIASSLIVHGNTFDLTSNYASYFEDIQIFVVSSNC